MKEGKNMEYKIKNCPCCGGEADIFKENYFLKELFKKEEVWVQCTECGLSTSRYDKDVVVDNKNGEEWAVSRWNNRI